MGYQFNPITSQLDLVSASAILDGEVDTWADLPQTAGDPPVGSTYFVKSSTGVWLVNRRSAGIWLRTGDTGVRANDWAYGGDYPVNSVAGKVGNVTLANTDISGLGTASTKDAPATGNASSTQVVLGNDTRLSDSRSPTAHSHTLASEIITALAEDPDNCRDALNLGDMATEPSSNFSQSFHTHGNLTNDGKVGSTSGLPLVTTTAGAVTTLALGTANQVLRTKSDLSGVEFADPSGGGVTGASSSASDVLGVSGANITGVDANADRIVFWDDSASKLAYLEAGSGLSLSGTTLTATATGTIGGSTSTDNAIVRADSTSNTVQDSALVIDDAVVPFNITGDAGTDIITAVGHNFTTNQGVRFPTLTGGSGLTAATTNYFVRDISGDTFKVSTTSGGAAVNFTTNITAGTVIAMQASVAIRNNSSETNSALVLTPKGASGFIVGPKPDAGTTGGNPRGNYAVDMQVTRTANTQVASGLRSVICGGENNTNAGELCFIGGGQSNSHGSAMYASVIGGGLSNSHSNISEYSVIAGGRSCSCTFTYGAIGGGFSNSVTSYRGAIAGGQSNVVSGDSGSVGGGQSNTASTDFAYVAGGYLALANRYGIQAHAAGQFAAQGDAQRIRAVLRCKTTTNAAVEMALNGSTTYLTIPSGKVIFCNIKVVGVKSDGSVVATFERQYAAKNVGGTSSEVFAEVTIGTDNASSTSLDISTVDAGDYISIKPTGIASETWRWVASVDAVEVAYGA